VKSVTAAADAQEMGDFGLFGKSAKRMAWLHFLHESKIGCLCRVQACGCRFQALRGRFPLASRSPFVLTVEKA